MTLQTPSSSQAGVARADNHWAKTYADGATMEILGDFLVALQQDLAAVDFYAALKRYQLFSIYYRLTSAKRAGTWEERMGVRSFEMVSAKGVKTLVLQAELAPSVCEICACSY